ncbi:MAG TPA: hypothetical protein VHY34_06135 [Caulobacteraceae bacterium]|nr:hypothetical protein [Caulobacteraceae bacterium]
MTRMRLSLGCLAALALAALGAGALGDFAGAAHAWLLGFVFVSLAPAGALVLILIARLTQAPWGRDFDFQLGAIAGAAPWLWLLGAPIAFLLAWIYPWAQAGGAPAHLRLYLSPLAFLCRAALALAGWSVLAALARRGRIGEAGAAGGLVFQAVVLCLIPNDWVLSLQPGWTTTNIGMAFLSLEIALTTATVLLMGPGLPKKSADDLAGLLVAGVLGLIYLTFMAYLIDWYGDLPDKIGWWLARMTSGRWLEIVTALAAGLAVFGALAFGRRYRLAGAAAIVGAALYCGWLVSPTLGTLAWLMAPAGLVFHAAALSLAASWRFGELVPESAGLG